MKLIQLALSKRPSSHWVDFADFYNMGYECITSTPVINRNIFCWLLSKENYTLIVSSDVTFIGEIKFGEKILIDPQAECILYNGACREIFGSIGRPRDLKKLTEDNIILPTKFTKGRT